MKKITGLRFIFPLCVHCFPICFQVSRRLWFVSAFAAGILFSYPSLALEITSPANNTTVNPGQVITFTAQLDGDDSFASICQQVTWSSSDGGAVITETDTTLDNAADTVSADITFSSVSSPTFTVTVLPVNTSCLVDSPAPLSAASSAVIVVDSTPDATDPSGSEVTETLPDPGTPVMRYLKMNDRKIKRRMSDLRDGNSDRFRDLNAIVLGETVSVGTMIEGESESDDDSGAPKEGFIVPQEVNTFVSGSFAFGEKDQTSSETGYEFTTEGLTFGMDRFVGDDRAIGVAFSYGEDDTEIGNDGGDVQSKTYTLALYGTFFRDNYYFDASLIYGRSDFEQLRNISYTVEDNTVNQSLEADFGSNDFVVSFNGGYEFYRGALSFRPALAVQYLNVRIDEYREEFITDNSGWVVEVGERNHEEYSLTAQAHVDYAMSLRWGVVVPTLQLDWIHKFSVDERSISAQFIGSSDPVDISVSLDEEDKDYFILGMGASAQFLGNKSGFIFYQQHLGLANVDRYDITIGFQWSF